MGTARKVLLDCGVLAALTYVAANVVGAMRWEGYSSVDQTVSELFAFGAPSRSVVAPLLLVHDVLLIAFGVGVWLSAQKLRALRITGALVIAIGVVGFLGPTWASIHLRGGPMTIHDKAHIALTVLIVILTLAAMGFAAKALHGWFRLYSIATVLILVIFGGWAGSRGGRLAANLPTPFLGVAERINIGGYLLWLAVLALALHPSLWSTRRTSISNVPPRISA